ncbi:uncharacterized protein Z519_10303 [Cladophialophora bantiana CBS 173.52]|uniref:Zn(2)-C6 fungal-type domain-containing protein n=1 Tax=Cladophialophora bantiana (strain ATCC 10958 / CBS 173.52 / CDC B-1940 / NIH 8579) TaxID=1442370 RepID=A0A0D2HW64_CLAB1|nr:uncharacterized protein Z519_10303 [Cladophialophora bantiana CBS 173.52]KIW88819.1 hypothetical protein Z519_10303 [Cladophialophora bantiana CBS 173.52]
MDSSPPPKRPRLSLACNKCRSRKVKCDAEYPRCRNCQTRNDECLTEDPRRPGISVVREWIEGPKQSEAQPQAPSVAHESPVNDRRGRPPIAASRSSPSVAELSAPAGSANEAATISPFHQPHEMSFNLDQQTNRIKMMGSSSNQTLVKSLDVYLQRAKLGSLSEYFVHGMRHAEEMTVPAAASALTPLPTIDVCILYMANYFKRVHILFPLFDVDSLRSSVCRLAAMSSLQTLPAEQLPILATAYLVLSLGADEGSPHPTADGDRYLLAATALLVYVFLMPYLPSVQCLLMFAISYRGRNKDGVAWQMTGMAIRIAHTLGLHRFSSARPSFQHGIQGKQAQLFHARIWGICCCLEKIMQLESGRPSAIAIVDRDQMMGPEQQPKGHDFLQWSVGLAQIQGLISDHICSQTSEPRSALRLLRDTARLDKLLVSWVDDIPYQFRPGADLLCPPEEFHMAAHLSIQYNQALIALHRAGLIAATASFQAEVTCLCADDPSMYRVREGESICVNSARAIARLTVEMAERKTNSRLISAGPQLLACVVLAFFLMKASSRRSQAADLELLRASAESVAEQFLNWGMDARFSEGAWSTILGRDGVPLLLTLWPAPLAIYRRVSSHLEDLRRRQSRPSDTVQSNVDLSTIVYTERTDLNPQVGTSGPYVDASQHPCGHDAEILGYGSWQGNSAHALQMAPPYSEARSGQWGESSLEDNVPFTGLNVEGLWNWLATDTTEANGEIDWTQFSNHLQQL